MVESDLYPEIPYEEVKVDGAVDSFEQMAKQYGTNYKMLKFLNPWLRKPFLTNKQGREYIIKVPARGYRTTTVGE
jgi:hypothetical protein